MIKNVVFDIGSVLVDFRWRALMQDLGLGAEAQEYFNEHVFSSCIWHELDHGTIEEADAIRQLREETAQYPGAFDQVWEHRDRLVDPYPYAVPWILSLKKKGLHVYLLSNYPRDIFTLHAENGSFPFLPYVDGKVVSGFVRLIKPDRDIYELLLERYGLTAEECVFIDDRSENIDGARAVGMQGIVFHTYEQASAELSEILNKINEKSD